MKNIIKVGFCVAYDWELLKKSIPRIYNEADTICLSIDKNRKSWSGKIYQINNEDFYSFVKEIDVDHKITIYEDDFSLPELSSIENDNRQRNLMSQKMGLGGWHIQIDSDEYFLDFKGFTAYLLQIDNNPNENKKPINICCNWISLIKKTEKGYIFVKIDKDQTYETMPFATNKPEYTNARRNGHFNHIAPFFVLHETWARGEDELWNKINSWGHDTDFNKQSYFNLWKSLDENNIKFIKNFHPIQPEVWPNIDFCEANNIEELIINLKNKESFTLSKLSLKLKNDRNFSRLKSIYKKIF